jgi:DNA-binding MarR family transcriptional regulator
MVMNGWLHREIDSQNRRKMRIIITRTGLELLDVLDPVIQEHTEGLNKLSDDENKTLSDLLDKLRG